MFVVGKSSQRVVRARTAHTIAMVRLLVGYQARSGAPIREASEQERMCSFSKRPLITRFYSAYTSLVMCPE